MGLPHQDPFSISLSIPGLVMPNLIKKTQHSADLPVPEKHLF